jgi:hypothetical protein
VTIRLWNLSNRTLVTLALVCWIIGAQAWYYYQFAGVFRMLLHGLFRPL